MFYFYVLSLQSQEKIIFRILFCFVQIYVFLALPFLCFIFPVNLPFFKSCFYYNRNYVLACIGVYSFIYIFHVHVFSNLLQQKLDIQVYIYSLMLYRLPYLKSQRRFYFCDNLKGILMCVSLLVATFTCLMLLYSSVLILQQFLSSPQRTGA